jgi:hypothetical protein
MNKATGPWEYFVAKVGIQHPDSCWEWRGSCGSNGYGNWTHGKQGAAHRAAYKLFFGDPASFQVNHKCGNRKCCNPEHLYAGTQKENMADAKRHKTWSHPPIRLGEENNTAVLKKEQVLEIRKRRTNGETGASLAREFGVTPDAICKIHKRKSWAWLQ